MRQTRQGRSWHFGMQCHMGTDPQGFVHALTTTNTAQSDISQLPALGHGLEKTRHGDKADWKEADREAYEALGGQSLIHRRGERTPERDALNRERSRICFARANSYSRWARSVGVNADGGRKRPPRPRIGAAQLPTSFVLVTRAALPKSRQGVNSRCRLTDVTAPRLSARIRGNVVCSDRRRTARTADGHRDTADAPRNI
jgi:hypothetical protein